MICIKNATIINEGQTYKASVWIDGERIAKILPVGATLAVALDDGRSLGQSQGRPQGSPLRSPVQTIDAEGLLLLPGVIDDQVHFREPGLTHKGDIHSESRAAISGGITSYMDMPNTVPQTTTIEALNDKFDRAAKESMANYSFFIGATNDNVDELKKAGARRASAIKAFMGSSTGNMLVDNPDSLEKLFAFVGATLAVAHHQGRPQGSPQRSPQPPIIAAHCESESIIRTNKEKYSREFGENLDSSFHSKIRSCEACYASASQAVALAKKHNSRLHLFHLSTAKEMELLDAKPLVIAGSTRNPLINKRITGEVCVHHLWFTDADYARLGNRIKWNPAIKTFADRAALRQALIDGKIDVVATDHAPHTWDEKQGSCLTAASGGPMVQHALTVMLELHRQGVFTRELIVEKMCHNPAQLFNLHDRGYIREGYYADLVLVDPNQSWTVTSDNLFYKCGWSPLEGTTFSHKVVKTFVNGSLVYDNGTFDENFRGKELKHGEIADQVRNDE
ncbi:MAG: amidohydrolase family protein [Candidatus Symbiothrix sp.]|jgi:dihydroorotase|nr:amidohydrolase family protein [Candidatus Symbiothrix sp.]